MKIIKKDYYRSEDRKVNQSDNMVRLIVTMPRNEFYQFLNKNREDIEEKQMRDLVKIIDEIIKCVPKERSGR